MNWTADQRRAIEARDQNLLLAAAAGSGKTTVLVERVVRLIEEGADIGGMLIVTFTRAAAADMRKALIRRLSALALAQPAFRAQAERAEQASISTIHAFCIELIRGHFQAAGVDPAFRVADEAQARILRARALDQALNAAYEQPSEDLLALDAGRGHEQVRKMAAQLHEFLMARAEPFAWLARAVAQLEAGDDAWAECLARAAARTLAGAAGYARFLCALTATREGLAHYLATAQADLAQIERWRALPYEALRTALETESFARLPSRRGLGGDPESLRYKALREQMKKLTLRAREFVRLPLAEALPDARATAPALRALARIVRDMDAAFTRLKDERSVLSYADLEHRALRALADEQVALCVRARYAHLFVDEYQDVSDVQEAILTRIARGDNLFMVGDVKQSIYRFRQAEPTLFIRKYARYARGAGGALIALSQNFRSRANILAFVNQVFARAMSGEDSELSYDEAAHLRLGARYEGEDAPIELALIAERELDEDDPAPEDAPEDADEQPEAGEGADALLADLNAAEAEALWVARRIRSLLGTDTYDPKLGRMRPLRHRDFVILTRQAKDVAMPMLDVLAREGIPAYADMASGYLAVMEVQVVLSALRLIENRRRDADWITLLRSPIGDMTSAELATIRLASPAGPYCEAIFARAQAHDDLAARLRALTELLDSWRALAGVLPLERLIHRVLRDSNLYAVVGALPGGAQRQANLDVLCERARAYEQAQADGLTGFLARIAEMSAISEDMGEAHVLGEGEDVVRLMTVHKSKGLEFPVVFGVQLGRKFRRAARKGELYLHPHLGAGLSLVDRALNTRRDTISRMAASECLRHEALQEELRVLYVLLTRAKDRLILVGGVKDRGRAATRFAILAGDRPEPETFCDLLAPAMLEMPGGAALAGDFAPEIQANPALPAVRISWCSRAALQLAERREGRTTAAYLDEVLAGTDEPEARARALSALTFRYPHAEAIYRPLKLTVSGLTRALQGPAQPVALVERPAFLMAQELTAAERGTAIHAALQGVDLAALVDLQGPALREALTRQLDAMLADGRLRAPMREAVPVDALARFFEGELGRRLLRARRRHREWMFTMRMPLAEADLPAGTGAEQEILVQGVIDCCFLENGGWILLDYKSDRADDPQALARRYAPQVALYARALARITGLPVTARALCLIRSGDILWLTGN